MDELSSEEAYRGKQSLWLTLELGTRAVRIPSMSTAIEREKAINDAGFEGKWYFYQVMGSDKLVSRKEHYAWIELEL